MRTSLRALIFTCLCWLSAAGQSSTVLAVDEHTDIIWPASVFNVCIVPEEGNCMSQDYSPVEGEVLSLGVVKGDVLLMGQLHNASDIPRSFRLEMGNPSIDEITVNVHILGDTSFTVLYGDRKPFRTRPVRHRSFILPFDLPPFGTIELDIRIHQQREAVFMPLRISSEEEFLRFYGKDYLLLGGLLGTYSIYIVFIIGLFLLARSTLFLYYALLDIFVILYVIFDAGYGFQFLWPAWPVVQQVVIPVVAFGYMGCIIMFTREFFSTRIKYPVLDRVFRVYMVIAIIAFVSILTVVLTTSIPLHIPLAIFTGLFIFLGLTVAMLGAVTYVQAGRREGFWFLFLFLVHLVMFALIPVQKGYLGWQMIRPDSWLYVHLPVFTSTPHYVFVIMTLEMVVVSALIAFRFQDVLEEYNISRWRMERINRQSIQAFIEGQEKEREALASQLRKQVGVGLDRIEEDLSKVHEKYPSSEGLETAMDQLEDVREDLRHIASDFVTDWNAIRTDRLIVKALEQLRMPMPDLELSIIMDKEVAAFPANDLIKLNLYRILQETCNNVLKHAEATAVTARIRLEKGDLVISVKDNGIGFDSSQLKVRKGIGLRNIETRTRAMHGKFRILSAPGSGTEVLLTIPYNKPVTG